MKSMMGSVKTVRVMTLVVFMLLVFVLQTVRVGADAGPKPSVTVHGENIPGEYCYMDLLVENPFPDLEAFQDGEDYNQDMLSVLQNYRDGDWSPAISAGGQFLLFGNIECGIVDGRADNTFSYIGVPDRFRVIVVTEDLQVVVSDVVERKAFSSQVSFDFETGKAKEKGVSSFIWQFFPAYLLTLLVEFLLLVLFRFKVRDNWKQVLIVNGITQILLHGTIIWGVMVGGIFVALLVYFFMEWLIVIGETIAFARILKGHSLGRKIGFSVVANFLSFFAGLFVVLAGML